MRGFHLSANVALAAAKKDAGAKRAAAFLAGLVKRTHGFELRRSEESSSQPTIRFCATQNLRAVAKPTGLTRHQRCQHYRGQRCRLCCMAPSACGKALIARAMCRPCASKTLPRFAWRGLMLDSARHYQSPEFIRRFIDAMAIHKLNVLHWHLTDDQAWRLEIKRYPDLTRVGGLAGPCGCRAAIGR